MDKRLVVHCDPANPDSDAISKDLTVLSKAVPSKAKRPRVSKAIVDEVATMLSTLANGWRSRRYSVDSYLEEPSRYEE